MIPHRATDGPGRPPGPAGPGGWDDWLRIRLFERRILVVRGPLDDAVAGRLAAELMMLDATGDDAVTLHVDSNGGPTQAAFTVIDTMDLLGVPVHTVCVGRAEGTAVGVVAAGVRRQASTNARFHLREPETTIRGTAGEMTHWADEHRAEADRFVTRLAAATGRPVEHLEADLAAGRWFDATQATSYGIVDGLWSPAPDGRSPGRGGQALGFGPGDGSAPS